jgi:hypothetical protein
MLKFIGSSTPLTLVLPGEYTTEDGKNFAVVAKRLREIRTENNKNKIYKNFKGFLDCYTIRIAKSLDMYDQIMSKQTMFCCSAGDGQLQLDGLGNWSPCHRYLYVTNDNYLKDLEEEIKSENTNEHIPLRSVSMLKKKLHSSKSDDKMFKDTGYVYTGFNSFYKFKNNVMESLIMDLAYAGQIDKEYLDNPEKRSLLSLMCNTTVSCPAESFVLYSSVFAAFPSVVRIFGNGALEEQYHAYLEGANYEG